VQLNNWNFHFSGNSAGAQGNNVGIGMDCNPLIAKLHVLQASGDMGTIGTYIENDDLSNSFPNSSIGLKVHMPNAGDNNKIAGWFEANYSAGDMSTAIYVPQFGGNVSIGYPSIPNTAYLLEVNGSAWANTSWSSSDQIWKQNIDTIDDPLAKINNIEGVYYYWDTLGYPQHNFDSDRQIGFIAQNVDTVLPEVVKGDNGSMGIAYGRITPLLLEAIKELDANNQSMQSQIDSLITIVGNCCNDDDNNNSKLGGSGSSDTLQVQLASREAILYQNIPNPFGDATLINFYLPQSCSMASMVFYDNFGNIIKEVEIAQRGNGSIRVDAKDLANGIYTYSLLLEGQVTDTRRMLRSR